MLKKFVICLLALAAFCTAFDSYAGSKREKIRQKSKTKQSKKEGKAAGTVWHKNLATAMAAAKISKSSILLVHIAPTVNNNSKIFNKNIIQNKGFAKAASGLVLVKFEYTDLRKISKEAAEALKKYPIANEGNKFILPTVYMLDHKGSVLDRKVGIPDRNPAGYLKSFRGYKKPRKK